MAGVRMAIALVASLFAFGIRGAAAGGCHASCRRDVLACESSACGALAGAERKACRRRCEARSFCPRGGAPVRTLAWVTTDCRDGPAGISGRQSLHVRHGSCDEVEVLGFDTPPGAQTFPRLCELFGLLRDAFNGVEVGPFQRLGLSPDGSTIVFEVTNRFVDLALLSTPLVVAPEQEGIYVVHRDGSGLRRIAAPSREASWRAVFGGDDNIHPYFPFSPDGRRVAFTDRGPGPLGAEGVQVFVLDLATGARTQVTRLPAISDPGVLTPATGSVFFATDTRVGFTSYANADGAHPNGGVFSVDVHGGDLRPLAEPRPTITPGAHIDANFKFAGPTHVETVTFDGTQAGNDSTLPVRELFSVQGSNALQLTNFGRSDTQWEFDALGGGHTVFRAAVDPLGENPSGNCQLFSIGFLGEGLHQITHFSQQQPCTSLGCAQSVFGCELGWAPGCAISNALEDPVTRSVIFYGTCDPDGLNPNGSQLFAMRSNGHGLHQLTLAHGMTTEADGTVVVQLIGPFDYTGSTGPLRQRRGQQTGE